MAMSKFTACFGREEMEAIDPPAGTALICIYDPNKEAPKTPINYIDKLFLQFWDLDKSIVMRAFHDKMDVREERELLHPATLEQIKDIYSFIQQNWKNNILVSCEAGISRSAAVREYLLRNGWSHLSEETSRRRTIPNNYILRMLNRLDYEKSLDKKEKVCYT